MKLIIINGPSGVGKSTISVQLQTLISGSVLIDIDELRRTIPQYRERREESLRLAYEKTAEAIKNHLEAGKSVIIDKTISSAETLDSFIDIGRRYGAQVYELMLFANRETVQKRADNRGYHPGGLLTQERVVELWEKADILRKERAEAVVIDSTGKSIEELFEEVKHVVC